MPDDRRPITWPRATAALDDLAARRQAQAIPTLTEDDPGDRHVVPTIPLLSREARGAIATSIGELCALLGEGVPAYAITTTTDGRARLTLDVTFDPTAANGTAMVVAALREEP